MDQNWIVGSGRIGTQSISNLGSTVIDRVEPQPDKPSGLHYFTPEDGDCFHAVAEDHERYKFAGMRLVGDKGGKRCAT